MSSPSSRFKDIFNWLSYKPENQLTLGDAFSWACNGKVDGNMTFTRAGRIAERAVTIGGAAAAFAVAVTNPEIASIALLYAFIAKPAGVSAACFMDCFGLRILKGLHERLTEKKDPAVATKKDRSSPAISWR